MYVCVGSSSTASLRARAHTHIHTEERNLSLTRILNGCAEARTVGTLYSTTHPPPLYTRILPPPSLFPFSWLSSSVSRLSLPSADSSSLSVSFPRISGLPPLPRSSLGWLVLLSSPTPPFLFLLARSRTPCAHGELSYTTTYTQDTRTHARVYVDALFSFHFSFRLQSLSLSVLLSTSFLREA